MVTNRNSIPSDPNGAWYISGIRLGTPALTTLGLGPPKMDEIADIITAALRATSAWPFDRRGERLRSNLETAIAGQLAFLARLAGYYDRVAQDPALGAPQESPGAVRAEDSVVATLQAMGLQHTTPGSSGMRFQPTPLVRRLPVASQLLLSGDGGFSSGTMLHVYVPGGWGSDVGQDQ